MNASVKITASDIPRRKLIVISHERSGTHFLMNTMATNFGYASKPWINFDFELGINFHFPPAILKYLGKFKAYNMLNIVKSHHQLAFFEPILPELLEDYQILYIHRHPGDVMPSMMRLLNALKADEGPRCATPGELIRCAPSGGMMRYQKQGQPNMIARWRDHVGPWVSYGEKDPRVAVISYEDLYQDFENTVRKLGAIVKQPVGEIRMPSSTDNVVLPGKGGISDWKKKFSAEDVAFIRKHSGDLLNKLYPEA